MVWPFRNKKEENPMGSSAKLLNSRENTSDLTPVTTHGNEPEEDDGYHSKYKYAPKARDEDAPMDLGTLQDIFSFSFMRGRPILNFILAILWSIGLPVLLYNLLRPHIGQVLAMIVASVPPLAIVVIRMIRERAFDALGCVAGVSFLISGILSIAEPDEKVASICESIIPLLVGVCCVISVIPIKIGTFELKPLVFQLANQVMPRTDDEALGKQDDRRLTKGGGQQKLDYLYTNMAKFRHDMRYMTLSWGLILITTFVVKVVVVMTNADISKAQTYGYYMFGICSFLIFVITWIYTNVIKGHVIDQVKFWKEQEDKEMDKATETAENVNWSVNSMSNVFNQVVGN